MNRFFIAAAIAGIIAVPAVAQQEAQVAASDPAAAAIVADCSSRKFETSVELEKEGQKRLTKLKLCAVQGSDQAAWVRTLQDAKTKIAAHPAISDESKAKIAAEFDVEIANARTVEGASMPPPAVAVSSAPALPVATPAPVQARPRLTVRCLTPGEAGKPIPCASLQRTTQLSIHADGDLAAGTRLRFLRRKDTRGEITLAGMRQGQMIRSNLPPQLCAGVATSKVEIQVIGSGQVVETLGPFALRC